MKALLSSLYIFNFLEVKESFLTPKGYHLLVILLLIFLLIFLLFLLLFLFLFLLFLRSPAGGFPI